MGMERNKDEGTQSGFDPVPPNFYCGSIRPWWWHVFGCRTGRSSCWQRRFWATISWRISTTLRSSTLSMRCMRSTTAKAASSSKNVTSEITSLSSKVPDAEGVSERRNVQGLFFDVPTGVGSAGASELDPPLPNTTMSLWGLVFNIQEKITACIFTHG